MTSQSPSYSGKVESSTFDVEVVRKHFPALGRKEDGVHPIYFDNPGGTQVPYAVIEAISDVLVHTNANLGGSFQTSLRAEQLVADTRLAMADLLNASSPDEIVVGPNMTTLTMALSRSLGKTLDAGDEIIVTHLDHDANIAPWLSIAADYNLKVKWVDTDEDDCTLDLSSLEAQIGPRTRVVAAGYASNAVGTINDVNTIVELARSVGALSYIDAVHYGPHGPIDVQALDCDFLVCSPYKFFGPHQGVLYGKRAHLERLPAYKVRPAPDYIPDRWETGTQNHEALAGVVAAIDYLAWVGTEFGRQYMDEGVGLEGRRLQLRAGMQAITDYERALTRHFLEGMGQISGVHVRGITALDALQKRVPTFAFTVAGNTPRQVAEALDRAHIYAWDGNYYALAIMERLKLEDKGGMVRIGAAHYNTHEEIERFLAELAMVAKS